MVDRGRVAVVTDKTVGGRTREEVEQSAWEFYGQDLGYPPEHLEGRQGRLRIEALSRVYTNAHSRGIRDGLERAAKMHDEAAVGARHRVSRINAYTDPDFASDLRDELKHHEEWAAAIRAEASKLDGEPHNCMEEGCPYPMCARSLPEPPSEERG
jgi:hypothetical protein